MTSSVQGSTPTPNEGPVKVDRGSKQLIDKTRLLASEQSYESTLPLERIIHSVLDADARLEGLNHVKRLLHASRNFDTLNFLAQGRADPDKTTINQGIIDELQAELLSMAGHLHEKYGLSIDVSSKQILDFIDLYDETGGRDKLSSFALRTALLMVSNREGGSLESWMVYTRIKPQRLAEEREHRTLQGESNSPKQPSHVLWKFLETKNTWIPEAQAQMAKYIETSHIKARNLSKIKEHRVVVLLKGIFGAGKTSHLRTLLTDSHDEGTKEVKGPIAPDLAKHHLRQSIKDIPHHRMHTQSSFMAYGMFDELIGKISGLKIYDSSLSRPSDIREYLEKASKFDSKVEIQNLNRGLVAPILSVLARNCGGADPRIPPNFIQNAILVDKTELVNCIKTIIDYNHSLSAESKEEKSSSQPTHLPAEYVLFCGNTQGTDTQKILTVNEQGEIQLNDEMSREEIDARLKNEGMRLIEDETGQLSLESARTKEELQKELETLLNQPVSKVLEQISPEEKRAREAVFGQRRLQPMGPFRTIDEFYDLCCWQNPKLGHAISKKEFVSAFQGMDSEAWIQTMSGKKTLSYLDLPLGAALAINAALSSDPWAS